MSRDARAHLPIRRFRLGNEPSDDLSDSTTADARLDMVWQLTLDAWATSGKAMPTYARHEAPGHFVRGYVRNAKP